MTIRIRVEQCSVKDCPWPDDTERHIIPDCAGLPGHKCVNRDGSLPIRPTHQHRPKVGMGGNNPKAKIVAMLCWGMHDALDNGVKCDGVYWQDELIDGRYWISERDDIGGSGGGTVETVTTETPSPLAPSGLGEVEHVPIPVTAPSLTPSNAVTDPVWNGRDNWLDADWSTLTDDELQTNYDYGQRESTWGLLRKCKAVHAYREKHVRAWGTSWIDQAYETFGASRRTLEGLAGMWAAAISVTSDAEQLAPIVESRSLVQHIGRMAAADAPQALSAAIHHVAVYGEPPSVRQLASGNAGREPEETARCPTCNQRLRA